AVIDTKTWAVSNTIALSASPNALLLVPGGRLYVSEWRNAAIAIVDPNQGGEVARVAIGGIPEQMAWDAEQRGVFVTLQDRATVAFIGEDNQISKRYKLSASQPTGLAIDCRQRRRYVPVR